jgi:hypothetical protein
MIGNPPSNSARTVILDPVPSLGIDPTDFEQISSVKVEQLLEKMRKILLGFENSHLRTLMECFLVDETLLHALAETPAGVKAYHAHPGGLLEHMVTLLKSAEKIKGLSSFKLSTDPVSVEAATGQLTRGQSRYGKLSTDPESVGATIEELRTNSIGWFTRRISLKVAASTDAGSVESKTFLFCFVGLAGQSLLPPTRGRWRAYSVTTFRDDSSQGSRPWASIWNAVGGRRRGFPWLILSYILGCGRSPRRVIPWQIPSSLLTCIHRIREPDLPTRLYFWFLVIPGVGRCRRHDRTACPPGVGGIRFLFLDGSFLSWAHWD